MSNFRTLRDLRSEPLLPSQRGQRPPRESFCDTMSSFFAPGFSVRTFIFAALILNITMYIVSISLSERSPRQSTLSPSTNVLHKLGCKWAPDIVYRYQLHRFVCPIFLHAGIIHILFNMLSQMQMGFMMEHGFGTKNIAVTYIGSGIGGVLLSCLLAPTTLSVGASGALFGLFGAQIGYLYLNWNSLDRSRERMAYMAALNLMINLLIGLTNSGIDNWAHLGGFFSGFLLAASLFPRLDPYDSHSTKFAPRIAAGLVMIFFVVGLACLWTVVKVPDYVWPEF